MRKICVIFVAAALAGPAVASADHSGGDGSLSISGASGTVWVSGNGVIYGHFDQGQLLVLSYKPDDGSSVPAVSSPKSKYSRGAGAYAGSDVRFLLASGRYTIELIATGVDLSAVGKGTIVATSPPTADPSAGSSATPGLENGSVTVNGGKGQGLSKGSTTASFGGKSG